MRRALPCLPGRTSILGTEARRQPRPSARGLRSLLTFPRHGLARSLDHATADEQFSTTQLGAGQEDAGARLAAESSRPPPVAMIKFRHRGHSIFLDPFWLRDICRCPQCVDPSTGQKRFDTADLPTLPRIKSRRVNDRGGLEIEWAVNPTEAAAGITAPHKSVYEASELNRWPHEHVLRSNHDVWPYKAWLNADMERWRPHLTLSWHKIMHHAPTLRAALKALLRVGLVFVNNAPARPESVRALAERFGPVRETFYGATWDVRAKADAENVAYTSGALGFHQDLLYMADPPALQVLHCLRPAAAGGGVSRFSDAARAFGELQRDDAAMAEAFGAFPVTYHYRNRGHWYRFKRKHVEDGVWHHPPNETKGYPFAYQSINWSPPFQGPLDVFTSDARSERLVRQVASYTGQYVQARRMFRERLERPDAVYETTLRKGDCVIFHNRRVVHARTAFEVQPGEPARWLRGCYVDGDALRSNYRVHKVAMKDVGEGQ